MPRKKEIKTFPDIFSEPKRNEDLLIEKTGKIIRYFFEDPYLVTAVDNYYANETGRNTRFSTSRSPSRGTKSLRTDEISMATKRILESKSTDADRYSLKKLEINPEDTSQVLYVGYLANVAKQIMNYVYTIRSPEKNADIQWNAGLDFGQSVKELVTNMTKYGEVKDERVMDIFDSIFDNPLILQAFAEVGLISNINGIEAEVVAWLNLRSSFGKEMVRFSKKEEDGRGKFDIEVAGQSRIQIKSGKPINARNVFDISNEDDMSTLKKTWKESGKLFRDAQILLRGVQKYNKANRGHPIKPIVWIQPVRREHLDSRDQFVKRQSGLEEIG